MTNTGIFLKERSDLVSKFAYSIFSGENIFRIWDFIFFLIIGIACSELGALLAIKYFKFGN